MTSTRTRNVVKNVFWALITQVLTFGLSFVGRTIFIYVLGIEYLGISGLFSNVLMLLSFAELGIGNAIIYSMYKPLANKQEEKIKALMRIYRKAYQIIGMFVFLGGLVVIPFMDYIIKEKPTIPENIILIYILFLINTAVSYFFVYKKSIIIADQKSYVVSMYQQFFLVLQTILQSVFLILTKQFLIFLVIQILCTILNNIFLAYKADQMYPYLREAGGQRLDNSEKKEMFKNISSLFMYKLASVILSGTDNIIISAIIGITAVGLSSNYLLLIFTFTTISNQIWNGFTASVGNLNATGSDASKEYVFHKMFFLSSWIHGFFSVGLFLLLNPFIELWLGKEYLLAENVVFALVLHFYILNMHTPIFTYRTTMGLFVKGKWAPVGAAVLNIVLSIWWGQKWGMFGIFLATSVARVVTTGLVDPYLVFRYGFHKKLWTYFQGFFLFTGLFVIQYCFLKRVLDFVTLGGAGGFFVKVLLVIIVFHSIFIGVFWRNEDFKYIKNVFTNILKV